MGNEIFLNMKVKHHGASSNSMGYVWFRMHAVPKRPKLKDGMDGAPKYGKKERKKGKKINTSV